MSKTNSRIAALIRDARVAKFKTAQLFHEVLKKHYEINYAHYTRVESGERFPEPGLLLAISRILDLDPRRLLHLWAREQMPEEQAKHFFEDYRTDEMPTINRDIEETYTFTEAQAPAMRKDTNIWEVACFIIHFQGAVQVTEELLHEELRISKAQLRKTVDWLKKQSIIEERNGVLRSRRTYLHIPYKSDEFFDVRNFNFRNLSSKTLNHISMDDLDKKAATRFTVLQRMSPETVQQVNNKLLALQNSFGQIPDEGSEFFNLCVISGSIGSVAAAGERHKGKK